MDYEAYYSYGSEGNTASANYRPRNSNTMLRKPKPGSKQKTTNNKVKPPQAESSSKMMSPQDDSFHISGSKKFPTSKQKSNELLSGASEFDNLQETTEPGSKVKKNLDKDFRRAAEEDNIFETKNKPDQGDEEDLEREVSWGLRPIQKPEEDDLERDTNRKKDPVP